MREYHEEDPKKPQPVSSSKKGTNPAEKREAGSWRPVRKDDDRDHHRHVA